ncbi:hypothetical protein EON83_23080 [bacterium]|nr:MAG: hypothetical protein EON83_23080 [bacterium]
MPLSRFNEGKIALCVGALCLFLVPLGLVRYASHRFEAAIKRDHARAINLHSGLRVGMTVNQVNNAIRASGSFKVHRTTSELWAQSPVIWGSLNWNVVAVFSKGKAVLISIRDSDSPQLSPAGAPADKSV